MVFERGHGPHLLVASVAQQRPLEELFALVRGEGERFVGGGEGVDDSVEGQEEGGVGEGNPVFLEFEPGGNWVGGWLG